MTTSSSSRGIACMILAAGTLLCNDTCMKLVMQAAPPLQVLFMRGLAASLWCLPVLAFLGCGRQIPMILNPWILLRCLCEIVAVTSFVLALKHMPLGDITAIYQTAPLIVLMGASLIWGEKIGLVRMVLIGIGILGAMLVAQPGATAASPYAIYGFLTALGSAARDLVSRKVPQGVPGMVVSFAMVLSVMLASALFTFLFESWVPPTGMHVVYMAAAGLFLMFGHLFLFLAFRLASPRTLAPFYYAFTVWAVLLGVLIFREVPNTLAVTGIVLIIGAGLAVLLFDTRREDASALAAKPDPVTRS